MSESVYPLIGQRIREERERRGLTQTELGLRMPRPVSCAAISDVERGKTRHDLDTLEIIAATLNTSLLWLITGASHLDYEQGVRAGREQAYGEMAAFVRAGQAAAHELGRGESEGAG